MLLWLVHIIRQLASPQAQLRDFFPQTFHNLSFPLVLANAFEASMTGDGPPRGEGCSSLSDPGSLRLGGAGLWECGEDPSLSGGTSL